MLLDVRLHHFAVKGERAPVGQVIGKLALLRLYDIDFADTHDVCQAILLSFRLILRLLAQKTLVREGSVDLLAQAPRRTLMFRRFLVKFGHFSIKLVNFGLIDACRSLFKWTALLVTRLGGAWRTRIFHFFNLPLHVMDSFLKHLVLKHFVAERDPEIGVQSDLYRGRIGPLHDRFPGRFRTCAVASGSSAGILLLLKPGVWTFGTGAGPIHLLGRLLARDHAQIRAYVHSQPAFNPLQNGLLPQCIVANRGRFQ